MVLVDRWDRKESGVRVLAWIGAVCAAVVLGSGTAGAALSHLGATGVVGTPTAEVTPDGYYDVAMGFVDRDLAGTSVKEWPLRLSAGIGGQAELGGSYLRFQNGESLRIIGLHGKVLVSRETESKPMLAVGAAFGDSDDFDFGLLFPALSGTVGDLRVTTVYLVATKTLSEPEPEYGLYGDEALPAGNIVRGSVGIMYNRYKLESATLDDSVGETKPFLGLEIVTPRGTSLAVEYKSKEKDLGGDPISSAVLRHRFSPGFWAEVGLTNAVHTVGDDDHEFFLGVQYRWGAVEEEAYF
jgi:hypothetical protein